MNPKKSKKQRLKLMLLAGQKLTQERASQDPIDGEEWKAIPGYEGFYEASSEGRIRSKYRRGNGKGRKRIVSSDSSVIIKPLLQKSGYNAVCMYRPSEKVKLVKVHRLVASAFLGESHLQVNHKDGNRTNNKIQNLEWCTGSENNLHAFRELKRKPKVNNKLTPTDVERIKELLQLRMKQRDIAKMFGVSQAAIWFISAGKTWTEKTLQHFRNESAIFQTT